MKVFTKTFDLFFEIIEKFKIKHSCGFHFGVNKFKKSWKIRKILINKLTLNNTIFLTSMLNWT